MQHRRQRYLGREVAAEMGEDAYSSFKPGGSLKFKGGETVASKKKKKHKSKDGKSKSSSHPIATSLSSSSLSRRERDDEAGRHVYDHSGHADDVDDEELSCKDVEGSSAKCKTPSNMTDAEKRFAEVQRRRVSAPGRL